MLLSVQVLWDVTLCLVARGLFGSFDPEGEGTATVRTVQSYWPDDTESHLGRFHFSTTLPLKIPVCGFHVTRFLLLYTTRVFFRSAVGRTEELVNHT